MNTPRHGPRRRVVRLAAVAALSAAPAVAAAAVGIPLLATLAARDAAAQAQSRVTGRVTSAGAPVGDAHVIVAGTRFGANTDADGRYTIVGLPAGSYTLRVQRLGYAPSTRPITVATGEAATADFDLTAAPTVLSKVLSVGYTTERSRDVSGAVASVGGDDIRDQKVATVEEALRGRVPGVQIAATGQPGRPAAIIVRGQNSFGNPSPLYVVDGMYVGQQNPNLNPDDIASIEVLKDASAAAQYGAQASNGVVLITTRKGREGAGQFSVGTYYGFQSVPKRIPVMGTAQWQKVYQQAYANAGITPPAGVTDPTTISTDWQDAVFQTGAIQNYNLQASGGSATATYLLSGSVLDQQGTVILTNFRRYSLRANSQVNRGRFTVGENLAVSQANQRGFPNGIFGGIALPLIDVVSLLPTIPVRDPNNPGGYGYGSDANPNYGVNPVGALEQNYNKFRANQVLGSAYGEVKLIGGLRYRLNLGINYNDSLATNWISSTQIRYLTPVLGGASLQQAAPNSQQLLYENLLNYDGIFGNGAHRLSAVAGQTSQNNTYQQLVGYRQGFPNEQLQQLNAGLTTKSTNIGYQTPFRTNSLLARATYALFDRYLFTGSVRHDCSTRFSPSDRCGNFGAGSVGWVASEESFWHSIPVLGSADFFKLRASAGVLGDQNIGDFAYGVPVNQNINYLFGGQVYSGATLRQLANTSLKWQRNRSTNVGLDLGVLDNSLSFTADYYVNDADQLLVNAPLPPSLASATNPAVNAGKVRNAGFELGATHRANVGDFRLNSTFTLTTAANRVVSLGNGGQPIFAGGFGGVARTTVGEPIGEFFLKKTCGIFQSAEQVTAHVAQPGAQPGDLCYVDVNKDGRINDEDRVDAGSPIPKVTSGLFLDSKWKAWDLGVNLRGAFGNKVYNAVRLATERVTGLSNLRSDYNPWTPTNTNTSTPRAVFGDAVNGDPLSDRWLESGNFVRLQNIIVGYTLPPVFTQRFGLGATNQPRIYFNAQNVYTWTNYTGFDPEVLGFGDPLARGVDDGLIYPNARTFTFGLDLRF
ncbi:MAG TPA: SusC/RagA family TonB-linked outer membrane protein [Gemmatimonadaceae bacterium]|nr:SusC/RagA family TonB-linked outer membrane protein [Gemmatimonadaceae bacterium]